MDTRLTGMIAAAYTPLDETKQLDLTRVRSVVDRLIADGVTGLYVCGSTGEGMSLSGAERRAVARSFVEAADGRIPVVVQVGHNSVTEAAELAAHAGKIGADAISATAPSYFKISSADILTDCMRQIAEAALELPFYYYHIPSLTTVSIDMVDFLRIAGSRVPNLAGIKYTCPTIHEYQACLEFDGGRFDILWGCDEMLLSALVVGAQGAVGSTYNIAAPLYRRIFSDFERGHLDEARQLQALAAKMIRVIGRWPFHPAMKEVLQMIDMNCGRCRLPLPSLEAGEIGQLRESLQEIGFFQWARPDGASVVPPGVAVTGSANR